MINGINKIYSYRRNFLVIGLTGRTGSGCSKTAELLSKNLGAFRIPKLDSIKYNHENDRRKARIVSMFAKENWSPFYVVRIKDIITSFILEHSFSEFCHFLSKEIDPSIQYVEALRDIETEYNTFHQAISILRVPEENDIEKKEKIQNAFKFYTKDLHYFTEKLKSKLAQKSSQSLYTSVYQRVGDNIRSCGSAFNFKNEFDPAHTDTIVRKTNKIIKVIKEFAKSKNQPAYVVIDALRNPFEVYFLRERFSSFFLVSVNTDDDTRKKRLGKLNFTQQEIERLDLKEYPARLVGKDLYISQNIQKCIELADIHINNTESRDENYNQLKRQLVLYYSLMLKPGLVIPTPDERIMQLAYSAKVNSGCISRQVGAAITDQNYSVKAIGWNNTPQNQVPCLLRSSDDLIAGNDQSAFTEYEKENTDFRDYFSSIYQTENVTTYKKCGHNISFCFKELHNNLNGDNNQVHTRSLHAEENAFLQLTKYGGQGIFKGILYSTASPCELCSKKAYQLGIERIIYIDPYPGIAEKQILRAGTSNPKLELFSGVVGRAYFQLYQPLLSYKDELRQAASISLKIPEKADPLAELRRENDRLKKEIEEIKSKNRRL